MVVQARNHTELGATLRQKCLFAAYAHLLDGFQAIDRERGTQHGQFADSGTGQGLQLVLRGRLEPFVLTQPGLE